MKIHYILLRDPAEYPLINQGQARISDESDPKAREELRGELSTFVCEGQFSDGLDSVGMEIYAFLFGDISYLLYRFYRTYFVIGMHRGYEYRLVGDGFLQLVQFYDPVLVHAYKCYLASFFRQELARIENGRMLDCGGNYVISL